MYKWDTAKPIITIHVYVKNALKEKVLTKQPKVLTEEPKVVVYGTPDCSYCDKAVELLEREQTPYTYYDVTKDLEALQTLKDRKLRTVPQVWVDNIHIGGYTQLREHLLDA